MGGYIIVVGGETLPEGFQGVQAFRAELIDCAKCAVIVCDGAEVPRVVRAAGVMINGDSAAVPSERVSGVQLITCGRGVKNTVSVTSDDGETLTLALGAEFGPKGSAVRRLKWHASWVQNVVRQFGPYLSWA